MKAVVIGSGFGGLGVALRLQARGIQTTIIEKRDKPGGRAYVYEKDGYRFDGGPTVITAPYLFENLFRAAGLKLSDYVELIALDPFYRIHFHDGTHFDYSGNVQKQEQQIAAFNPADVAHYRKFMKDTARIFKKGLVELGEQPFLSLLDMLKVAPDLVRLDALRSVYSFVSKYFENENLRRVFSFHPLLIGGSPFRAPAIYTLIHTLEKDFGVHYARGGTGSLVNGICQAFQEKGGEILLNNEVGKIEVERGRARSVLLKSGERISCDLVISNGDLIHTYGQMVDAKSRKFYSNRRLENYSLSMSLVVIYFGVRKKYPDLEHHNIILSERYRELIEDIFDRKVLADDFSLYLHIPTKTDASLAPEGCDSCYVLAPVPHLTDEGVDWKSIGPDFENRILKFLNDHYMPGLLENLEVRMSINPLHFKNVLLSESGNAFGVEPVLMQSAFFRPHNRSQDIKNLYLVGANTQPGAGMPGVLLSAQITDKLIAKDFRL